MSTRIRYAKKEETLLVTEDMLARDHIVRAEIDTSTMSYKVFNKEDRLLEHGATKTLASAKKHVKATLKGLGVQFSDEVRKSREVKNEQA